MDDVFDKAYTPTDYFVDGVKKFKISRVVCIKSSQERMKARVAF